LLQIIQKTQKVKAIQFFKLTSEFRFKISSRSNKHFIGWRWYHYSFLPSQSSNTCIEKGITIYSVGTTKSAIALTFALNFSLRTLSIIFAFPVDTFFHVRCMNETVETWMQMQARLEGSDFDENEKRTKNFVEVFSNHNFPLEKCANKNRERWERHDRIKKRAMVLGKVLGGI